MQQTGRSMSRWNVLALFAAVVGAVLTLGADHWWMHHWIHSGTLVSVGNRAMVPLEPGRVLAYYESTEAVPRPGMAEIHVLTPSGTRLPIMPAYDESDYSIPRHGWTGRLLWEFHAPEAGLYDIGGFNNHYLADADIPPDDRVVIGRSPELLDHALAIRNTIRGAGVSLTLVLVVGLYIPHIRTMRRQLPARSERPDI